MNRRTAEDNDREQSRGVEANEVKWKNIKNRKKQEHVKKKGKKRGNERV